MHTEIVLKISYQGPPRAGLRIRPTRKNPGQDPNRTLKKKQAPDADTTIKKKNPDPTAKKNRIRPKKKIRIRIRPSLTLVIMGGK